MTSASSRLVLAAALALAQPVAAWALDVKLWPLGRYTADGDQVRWSALGPLLEFRRTATDRTLLVRPLLALRQRRGQGRDDRADILYPLASTRWQDDTQSARFLLFTYLNTPAAAGERGSRLTLFPFFFYRSNPTAGSRLSLFPFYLDVDDLFGYERVQAILFPLFARTLEPQVDRRFYLFPFVSTLGGADGRGFAVWPFYSDREVVGRSHIRYLLWPFHVRSDLLVPGYGWEHHRLDLPVFAAIDGDQRQTRAWGLLAHIHTIDQRRGTDTVAAPWPLVVRERRLGEEEDYVWRLWPVYGRSDTEGLSSRFWAWPAYRRKIQDVDDFHYERRDAGLILWRSQWQRNATSGREDRLLTLVPLLRAEGHDGRASGQVPALADSLLPKNRGVRDLWAPLYRLVGWQTGADGAHDWSLLWGLVERRHGRLVGPWRIARDSDGLEPVDAD